MTRSAPWAEEAELSVLGACLIDADAVATAGELLTADAFYRETHRRIYRAIERLAVAGTAVDPVTVTEELKREGELDAVGGPGTIVELLGAVPSAANISYHARIVAERWTQRRMIAAADAVAALGYEPGESVERALGEAQTLVCDIDADVGGVGLVWMHDAMTPAFADIERRMRCPGGVTGLATGFRDLDEMTGGLQASDLVLVAARPSQGKTALLASIALAVAHAGRGVAFFSAEMSREQIVQRLLCHEALADLLALRRGTLPDDDLVRLAQAAGHLNAIPLYLDDRSSPTVAYIRGKARKLQRECPDLALVVVDYLGLCTPRSADSKNDEIGTITSDLKALAKDLGVCVLAAHQLSRAPMARADHRPQLHDLRDSGNLEQDADVVLMLHRPEQYITPHEAEEQDIIGYAELLVRKQRNGPTGDLPLYFRAPCARFETGTRREVRAVSPRRERKDWLGERERQEA